MKFSDINNIKELSLALTHPLIAAAIYTQFNSAINDLITTYAKPCYLLVLIIIFFTLVCLVTAGIEITNKASSYLTKNVNKYFNTVFTFTLLTIGVLPISYVINIENIKEINLLWHLGCLSWGFRLIHIKSIEANKDY